MDLVIWLDQAIVGRLTHHPATNEFGFEYLPDWVESPDSYPLSPHIPLEPPEGQTRAEHSAQVRQFFENLLPEGEALDHAATANKISKANLVGLLVALGKETAGAIRVTTNTQPDQEHDDGEQPLRLVTPAHLSERIRQRPYVPFSVWDGRVRLSIAGYQDKIAVYERDGHWYLVNAGPLASTVIVKPPPTNPGLANLPANEFLCMQLADRVGLRVPRTRLVFVPEPVLLVDRFDRAEQNGRVRRLHLIDGCQGLGVSVGMKYERPYGDNRDVQHIRDGVSYPQLFGLLHRSPQPTADRLGLLRWAIFQILIGNTDAHGKNVSFFMDNSGLRLAPFYDMVCMEALGAGLTDSYAMAIGDVFTARELSPFEWASFARACKVPIRAVAAQLGGLAREVLAALPATVAAAVAAGAPQEVADQIEQVVTRNCEQQLDIAPHVPIIRVRDVT